MVVRSRSSLRVSARRDDADPAASTRASRRRLDGDAPSLAHAKGALDQKDSRPHRPLPRRPARPQRPSSRRPPLSSRPASAAHGRPPRRARPPSAAPAKQPLRCRESPDPLNTISSPTASPPRPRPRLSAPAALAGSGAASPPSAAATRATRRSGHALPVAVDNDADKTPAGPSTSGDDAARPNGAPRSSTRNPPAASNGNVVPTERRSLRSHDGGSRSRSELAQYFPNYEQMISLEPPKPVEFLTGDTTAILIDDLTEPPLSPPAPSSPSRSRKRRKPSDADSPFGNPLLQLHDCEVVQLPEPDPPAEDPLGDDTYFKAHRRIERQEKQLRNIERERAQHEKLQLDRLLDELQGHDWLRVMGISGITESEKKLYEPKRALFIKEVSALIEKFKVWKEEEKRRKQEKEQQMLLQAAAAAEKAAPQQDEHESKPEEEEEEEEEDIDAQLNGGASSDIQSFGEPPDINDVDALAARQLLQEAKSASRQQRQKTAGGEPPHSSASPQVPPSAPPPEKPFTSFYSNRYLRDAALAGHRRGRSRSAFGQPIPDLAERDFELPPDILTEEAINSCMRKRRRLRRESRG
ncbi:something about silencing, SAS, complex subunit 4-domain-containing protein [Thermoascus aurantiacus ATCC 26904]